MIERFRGLEKKPALKSRNKSGLVSRQVRVPSDIYMLAVTIQHTFAIGEKPSKHDIFCWLAERGATETPLPADDFAPRGQTTQETMYFPKRVRDIARKQQKAQSTTPPGGLEAVYIAFMRAGARMVSG